MYGGQDGDTARQTYTVMTLKEVSCHRPLFDLLPITRIIFCCRIKKMTLGKDPTAIPRLVPPLPSLLTRIFSYYR